VLLKRVAAAWLASLGLLAAGCSREAPTPTINESMTQVMQPQAQTIWDITSHAFNDKGDGLDASKLTAGDWAQLEKAGQAIRDRALVLANAKHVTVAKSDEAIMGQDASHGGVKKTWDAASVSQVQGLIDANPSGFAQHAQVLAQAGDTVVKASQTKDAAKLYGVSSNLDEVCDGCHQPFWGTDEPPPFPGK
jgi:hypothetical protein